ncbi:MAG TPA: hypothetical protein VNB29_11200 [Chthoniobacterales bacterium]|nr:hypothetical protein [Chthoniobacterales bacterium]
MKNLVRLVVIALAMGGVSMPVHAAGKKPVDFSEMGGKYTGTGTAALSGSTVLNIVGASIVVTVPKNGRSAVVSFTGMLTDGNAFLPIHNTFTFAKNKSFVLGELLYGLSGSGYSSTGSYSGTKALSFTSRFDLGGTTGSSNGSLVIKPAGKKHRKLTFYNTVQADGQPVAYIFTFTATAKVKPPKK